MYSHTATESSKFIFHRLFAYTKTKHTNPHTKHTQIYLSFHDVQVIRIIFRNNVQWFGTLCRALTIEHNSRVSAYPSIPWLFLPLNNKTIDPKSILHRANHQHIVGFQLIMNSDGSSILVWAFYTYYLYRTMLAKTY